MHGRTMKRALLILLACLLASTLLFPALLHPSFRGRGAGGVRFAAALKPKAIYLVSGQGQFSAAELSQHPEVVIVHTFHDLQALATDTDIALWIDKDAAQLADSAC